MDIVRIRRAKTSRYKKSTNRLLSHFKLSKEVGLSIGVPFWRCAMNEFVPICHPKLASGSISSISIDRFRVEHGITISALGGVA